MSDDATIRSQLVALLHGGNAYMPFDHAVADFPAESMNTVIPAGTYTPWHLLEHIRLAQRDILEFMTNPAYVEQRWPDDYWPSKESVAGQAEWQHTIDQFHADLTAIEKIAQDLTTDLSATIAHGSGQTIVREILLVADHNAYHTGEFTILRQIMGTWPAGHQ